MATFAIEVRQEGRGNPVLREFQTLAEVQRYVRERWEGAEYIDTPAAFHNDYCTFDLIGVTLADLGTRNGPAGTQEYWSWTWKELGDPMDDDDSDLSPAGPVD